MSRKFRRAEPADVPAAQSMYRAITEHAGSTGDPARWNVYGHPDPSAVAQGVHDGELYLAVEKSSVAGVEELVGGVILNQVGAEGYDRIPWRVQADNDQILVAHILGVHPGHLRRGVARFLLEQAAVLGRQQGLAALRLETFPSNEPARELYLRAGFKDLGEYELGFGDLGQLPARIFELDLSAVN